MPDWNGTGYRLPTEMEWMWAAMGGTLGEGDHDGGGVFTDGYSKQYAGHDRTIDPSGTNIDNYAWHSGNSQSPGMTEYATHEVGVKDPNELGLYDMSGNVYEWCWDWYAGYPSVPWTDYPGGSGSYHVYRGGCWGSFASVCAVDDRSYNAPVNQSSIVGFRFLMSAD